MTFATAVTAVCIGALLATGLLYPWFEKYTDKKWDWEEDK